MTPEELDAAIDAVCRKYGYCRFSYEWRRDDHPSCYARHESGRFYYGKSVGQLVNDTFDPVAQREWNEERMRAGA